MEMEFTIGTGEDGRPLALSVASESGNVVDVASIAFHAWARGADGLPTGAIVVDATEALSGTDGMAVWDATEQRAAWVLPDGGYATPRTLLGLFVATNSSGDSFVIPSPNDGKTVYVTINIVQVGPAT